MADVEVCAGCSQSQVCVKCLCKSPARSYCISCLGSHLSADPGPHHQYQSPEAAKDAESSLSTSLTTTSYVCSNHDSLRATHFCLCGNVFLCPSCVPQHSEETDVHDLYPIVLLFVLGKDPTGGLLKRGKAIDLVRKTLEKECEDAGKTAIAQIEAQFEVMDTVLKETKRKAIKEAEEYFSGFKRQCVKAIKRLKDLRYAGEWGTKLSRLENGLMLDQAATISEVKSGLTGCHVSLAPFTSLCSSLFSFKNWAHWFSSTIDASSIEADCIPLPLTAGGTAVYSLSRQGRVEARRAMEMTGVWAWVERGWVCEDGEHLWMCGGDLQDCRKIGSLGCARASPGLAYTQGTLYLFGGYADNNFVLSAELFNIDTEKGRALQGHLPTPVYASQPCVVEDTVYFGGLQWSPAVMKFDIRDETYSFLPVTLPYPSSGITLYYPPSSLLILTPSIYYLLSPQDTFYQQIAPKQNWEFACGLVPVKRGDRWLFTGRREDGAVFLLEMKDLEVREVGGVEETGG